MERKNTNGISLKSQLFLLESIKWSSNIDFCLNLLLLRNRPLQPTGEQMDLLSLFDLERFQAVQELSQLFKCNNLI